MEIMLTFLKENFLFFPIILFVFLCLRFVIIAGGSYLLLWKIFKNKLEHRLIQNAPIKNGQIKQEIKYSLIAFFAMSVTTWPLFYLFIEGKTAIYTDWNDYSLWMIPASLLLLLLWHDIYFYWTHYWLHTPKAFKKIHYVHHLSKVPTPFSSHSFHWIEGVMQIAFIYPLVLWVPMHVWTFIALMALTHFFAAWGHLNYELMPLKTWDAWWGSWVTTSTHHNYHHKFNNGNLALYLRQWDRSFKTLNPNTEEKFHSYLENIKSKTS